MLTTLSDEDEIIKRNHKQELELLKQDLKNKNRQLEASKKVIVERTTQRSTINNNVAQNIVNDQ